MPNADQKTPSGDLSQPQDYPIHPAPATHSYGWILRCIAASGGMPFPDFMKLALYDPEHGYYAKETGQVGRGGDFYTSVSVGSLFGRLLARRFARGWEEMGKPAAWRVLEIGAHDGKLAADILYEIRAINPDAWQALQYAIAEPLPLLREAQHNCLKGLTASLCIVPNLSKLAAVPLPGFVFGNEILDAMPFHLVEMSGGKWHEMYVVKMGETLSMEPRKIDSASPLAYRLTALGIDFPDGYRTELRTCFPSFLSGIAACLKGGTLLFIDYGFAAPEYYDRYRSAGTLRTFSNHKAADDPLASPGEKDITAHVDFTCLAEAAATIGFHPTVFSSQGSYLTRLAEPLILGGCLSDSKTIAQFQTLTHPTHLGASFQAIEFGKGVATTPEVRHRLAL